MRRTIPCWIIHRWKSLDFEEIFRFVMFDNLLLCDQDRSWGNFRRCFTPDETINRNFPSPYLQAEESEELSHISTFTCDKNTEKWNKMVGS